MATKCFWHICCYHLHIRVPSCSGLDAVSKVIRRRLMPPLERGIPFASGDRGLHQIRAKSKQKYLNSLSICVFFPPRTMNDFNEYLRTNVLIKLRPLFIGVSKTFVSRSQRQAYMMKSTSKRKSKIQHSLIRGFPRTSLSLTVCSLLDSGKSGT